MMLGEVVAVEDPLKIGRVRVRVPGIFEPESPWAFPMGMMLNEKEGFFRVPSLGANVIVFLNQGEVDHPYYMPGPFGAPDGNSDVPEQAPDGSPDITVLRFRDFHITLDGTPGAEKLIIEDLDSTNRIEFDRTSENFSINVEGEKIVEIKGDRSVAIEEGDDSLNIQLGSRTVNIPTGDEIKTIGGSSTENITGPKVIAGQTTVSISGLGAVTINGASLALVSTGASSMQSGGNRTETFQGNLVRNITGAFTSVIQGVLNWTLQGVATLAGATINIGNGPYKKLATEDFVLNIYNSHDHTETGGVTGPPNQLGTASHLTAHLNAS